KRGGITPLMMAAAGARPSEAAVRLLLEKGADVQARDERGRNALDWALTQGETPSLVCFGMRAPLRPRRPRLLPRGWRNHEARETPSRGRLRACSRSAPCATSGPTASL